MRYLSEAWLSAATDATAGCAAIEPPVRIGYRVVDGPDGDAPYTLVLGDDGVRFEPGLASTDLVLTLDYDLASAIARGSASAQRAFLDGEIRVGGDVTVLLGTVDALAAIDDRLADLRSVTSYR